MTRSFACALARPAAIAALVLALGLAGCGRKGGLDLPPGAAVDEPPPVVAAPSGPSGLPPTPRGQKRPLPVDVLID